MFGVFSELYCGGKCDKAEMFAKTHVPPDVYIGMGQDKVHVSDLSGAYY